MEIKIWVVESKSSAGGEEEGLLTIQKMNKEEKSDPKCQI